MNNIIIPNKKNYENIIENIIKGGSNKLHVLSDFDRTLTQAFSNGEYRASLISVLYNEGYLSTEYQKAAQGLFEYYHPIEINENIPLEERKSAMQERREKHKLLLIKEGITKQDIYNAMKSQNIKLRNGSKSFFEYLQTNNIPLIIISAGGLGTISIQKYLEQQNSLYDNIFLIGNEFIWDKNNIAIDFKRPIIHSLNKDETIIQNFPEIYNKVKDRKNVILLGDSIGDTKMINGFDYNNLLKIGFLNKDIEKNLEKYKEAFDVIITEDGNMDFVNTLLEKVFNTMS